MDILVFAIGTVLVLVSLALIVRAAPNVPSRYRWIAGGVFIGGISLVSLASMLISNYLADRLSVETHRAVQTYQVLVLPALLLALSIWYRGLVRKGEQSER